MFTIWPPKAMFNKLFNILNHLALCSDENDNYMTFVRHMVYLCTLCSDPNNATRATNKLYTVQKSCYCPIFSFDSFNGNNTIFYPMPCKKQPIRGQDCQCIFCSMQRVVFTRTSRHYLCNKTMFVT